MVESTVIFVSDACVLIDYYKADPRIIKLVNEHIGAIHVPRQIFNEIEQIDNEEANRLGLNIIDATINQMEEASARGGPLSMEDKLTFIIARDNRQVCWTSDKNLRNKCLENGVSVYWGLEILLILCREGRLTVQRALKTAEKIKECGAHISKEVLDDFRNQVDEIFSPRIDA
jgi:rRNA-processing protein FCF1